MSFPPLNAADRSRDYLPQPGSNTVTSISGTTGITGTPPRNLSIERPSGDADPSNRLPPSASRPPEPLRVVPESAMTQEDAARIDLSEALEAERATERIFTVLAREVNHQLGIACAGAGTPFVETEDPGSVSNMLMLISADKRDIFWGVRSCIRNAMQGNVNFDKAALLQQMCPPCDSAVLQTLLMRVANGAGPTAQKDRSALLDQYRIYAQHLRDSLFQGLANGNTSKVFPELGSLPHDVLQQLHARREEFRTLEQEHATALAMANKAQSLRVAAEDLLARWNPKPVQVATADGKE